MKKLFNNPSILLYTFLALIVVSCKNKNVESKEEIFPKKSVEVKEKIETISIVGTYVFGKESDKESKGKVYVYPTTDSTAIFYLDVSEGAPNYMLTTLYGEMLVKNNIGIYDSKKDKHGSEQYGDSHSNCVIKFEFKLGELNIKSEVNECGFGKGTSVFSNYKRIDDSTPEYFENILQTKRYPIESILKKYKK